MPANRSTTTASTPAETLREVETKFAVYGRFRLPHLVDPDAGIAAVRTDRPSVLRATYYDAADLRLARDGITLRQRSGEGIPRWTLKLPTGASSASGLSRDEVTVPGAGSSPPAQLVELLTARLRREPLEAVAVLRTERTTTVLLAPEGDEMAELVDDTVSLLEGRRVVLRFREIEVEQHEGGERAATSAAQALLGAGAVVAEQLPKLSRALGPRASLPGDLPAPVPVTPQSPAGDLVRDSVRTGLARLVDADVGVRRGASDAVHQMRVACRRLRSDLRTFAPLLDDERAGGLRDELTWLADVMGSARDLEVLRERLHRTAASDPLSVLDPAGVAAVDAALAADEQDGLDGAREALRSDRYVDLLELLVAMAREPRLSRLAEGRCADVLPPLVRGPWQRLGRRARSLGPSDPDEDWHRARILAKRARYAAEAAAPALGRPARRVAQASASAQEMLGEHQDAATAAERILTIAAEETHDVRLAVTAGRLAERERAAILAVRREFHERWRAERRRVPQEWRNPH